jgi:hypothetical protein
MEGLFLIRLEMMRLGKRNVYLLQMVRLASHRAPFECGSSIS